MKFHLSSLIYFSVFCFLSKDAALARLFTDDGGRQVEAELLGVRGEYVVLSYRGKIGKWPTKKLSKPDQNYVKSWQKNPPLLNKDLLTLSIWDREGMGERGVFEKKKDPTKNIPLLRQTAEKSTYVHYEFKVNNLSKVDANTLTLAYTLYIVTPNGQIETMSEAVEMSELQANKSLSIFSKGINYIKSKTTDTTLQINPHGRVSTGQKTSRSKENLGGSWVRLYALDGTLITEKKDFSPKLKKLNPAWVGTTKQRKIPTLSTLDELKKLVEQLPKPPFLPKDSPKFPPSQSP